MVHKRKRHKDADLRQVAHEAGVSTVTVWRVLKNDAKVAEQTRRRVLRLLQHFRVPLPVDMVGLIVPDAGNPFWGKLTFEFEIELESVGIQIVVATSEGKVDKELAIVERFRGIGIAGLIFAPVGPSSVALAPLVADRNVAVIVLDRHEDVGVVDSFSINGYEGTAKAVEYVVMAKRHRTLGYLRGSNTFAGNERFQAFQDLVVAMPNVTTKDSWIFQGNFTLDAGRKFAAQLIEMRCHGIELPTAIIAGNDLMAIGLINGLQEAGWRLPAELSIIGFDNIPWADYVYPPLTTIHQPLNHLARVAVNRLKTRIAEIREGVLPRDRAIPQIGEVHPELVERGSVSTR